MCCLADFGYVGGAPGKIDLYVGKEVVRRGIPMVTATDELIELIKQHGRWAYSASMYLGHYLATFSICHGHSHFYHCVAWNTSCLELSLAFRVRCLLGYCSKEHAVAPHTWRVWARSFIGVLKV